MKPEDTYLSDAWKHPGGKLIEEGADKLSDTELLSILIGIGIKGRSAEEIAREIILKFGGFRGMAEQPLAKFLDFKGLGDVKIIRIAAAFELARRFSQILIEQLEPDIIVNPKDGNENLIAWDGRIYRAITTGVMLPEQMYDWLNDNGDKIHKINADKKVVISGQGQDDYIVANGRLYRSITTEIKDFDEIDEWLSDNGDFILELEKLLKNRYERKGDK